MKLYADVAYYRSQHLGQIKATDEDVEKALRVAARKIDSLTFSRIIKLGFENLLDAQKELIKQACCFQADYISKNGMENENNGLLGYSVLDMKISFDKASKNTAAQRESCSLVTYMLLEQTGLMSKVVG